MAIVRNNNFLAQQPNNTNGLTLNNELVGVFENIQNDLDYMENWIFFIMCFEKKKKNSQYIEIRIFKSLVFILFDNFVLLSCSSCFSFLQFFWIYQLLDYGDFCLRTLRDLETGQIGTFFTITNKIRLNLLKIKFHFYFISFFVLHLSTCLELKKG